MHKEDYIHDDHPHVRSASIEIVVIAEVNTLTTVSLEDETRAKEILSL